MVAQPVLETAIDTELVHKGKVRDVYASADGLIFVATDRLSAFDVVFAQGIAHKGKVLTHLSSFWAETLDACQPFHALSTDVDSMGSAVANYAQVDALRGRTMLVEKLEMAPVECVVRGYLVGSGWKDYQATGAVCGHVLPAGMQQGDAFPEPLYTPATKADIGDHDENISYERTVELVGEASANELRQRSMSVYAEGAAHAAKRGLILVDTKFEFGRRQDGTLVLADEVLTPDSSRYWDAEEAAQTERGKTPPSFDKQIVRDYLETLDWNKRPPAPTLPDSILDETAVRYLELVERLTGAPLPGI